MSNNRLTSKRFVDQNAITQFLDLCKTPGVDLFTPVELVKLEAKLHGDMARYPWLNKLIMSCAYNFTAMPADRIRSLRELTDQNDYQQFNELSEEEIRKEIQKEQLKLQLLDQQVERMKEDDKICVNTKDIEDELDQKERQLSSFVDPLCEQMLNLRLFISESQCNEEIFRIGERIESLLQQLNGQMPNIDTLVRELVVRHSRDSDVKLVQMAKALYGNKIVHIHNQLKVVLEACEHLIEFLKTKIYGGVLLRKAINELNGKIVTLDKLRSLPVNLKPVILNELDEQLVQELIDFDFNDRLAQLRTHLADQLKNFVN